MNYKMASDEQIERSYEFLAKRAMDTIPISVGTSLAIEAAQKTKGYDSLWINIRTLIRNIYDSVERESRDRLLPQAVAWIIYDELKVIRNVLSNFKGVRLYCVDYRDLPRVFPNALLRDPKGQGPVEIEKLAFMEAVINYVKDDHDNDKIIWEKTCQIQGEPTKSLIMTHYPVDLLSRTRFKQLRLLESYTGAIKSRSQWGTKLTDGKALSFMPFNRFTLQLFGDNNLQFKQFGRKVREPLLKIAVDNKWTPVTTTDKIRWNIGKMADQFTAKMLKKFL